MNELYLLGPGDELNIVVFNHEDLSALCVDEAELATTSGQDSDEIVADGRDGKSSGCAVVGDAGTISLPLVGEIRASGADCRCSTARLRRSPGGRLSC